MSLNRQILQKLANKVCRLNEDVSQDFDLDQYKKVFSNDYFGQKNIIVFSKVKLEDISRKSSFAKTDDKLSKFESKEFFTALFASLFDEDFESDFGLLQETSSKDKYEAVSFKNANFKKIANPRIAYFKGFIESLDIVEFAKVYKYVYRLDIVFKTYVKVDSQDMGPESVIDYKVGQLNSEFDILNLKDLVDTKNLLKEVESILGKEAPKMSDKNYWKVLIDEPWKDGGGYSYEAEHKLNKEFSIILNRMNSDEDAISLALNKGKETIVSFNYDGKWLGEKDYKDVVWPTFLKQIAEAIQKSKLQLSDLK